MSVRRWSPALAAALAVLLVPVPGAVADGAGGNPHGDPGAALPDTLVTQPVAAAELGGVDDAALVTAGPNLPETWCGQQTTVNPSSPSVAHFKLIYAYASDRPDRFATFRDRLQANVSLLGRYMAAMSGARKAVRWDMGTGCATNPEQYVDIQTVKLPQTLAEYNDDLNARFGEIDADVRSVIKAGRRGRDAGPRNLMILADGLYTAGPDGGGGTLGQGSVYRSPTCCGPVPPDDPAFKLHDEGGLTSVVYGHATPPAGAYAWPGAMLHEMTHNMGAVQNSAPHTSGAGHCDDRYDVMCYPDGGDSYQETRPCPRLGGVMADTYDCGGDDYFSPDPAPGSYLATHWNVFDVDHLMPCAESAVSCGVTPDGAAPDNTTPEPGEGWLAGEYAVTLTGADTGSDVTGFEWRLDDGPVQTGRTATVAGDGVHRLETRVGDAWGNWSPWRADTVRIDLTDPDAGVACPEGWQAVPVRCAVSGADAGSGLAALAWRAGADPELPVASGDAVEIGTEGVQTVAVTARDGVGRTRTAVGTARVDLSPPSVALACTPLGSGQHRCTAQASDAVSGLAALRAGGLARLPGQPFDVRGPARLTATATDVAGRSATSAAVTLDGAVLRARRSVALRSRGRVLATGTVELAGAATRRATATLAPRRLGSGTWRLSVCVERRPCARRTVVLRRAGRPAAVRRSLPWARSSVRASFVLERRSGRAFRRVASGATSASLR